MSVDAWKEHVPSIIRVKESESASRTGGHVPLKCWSTLIGLYVVAAQKIELFIIIDVRTSNSPVV
jgi:hypothetical protein